MMKRKPTKEECLECLKEGMSLTQIGKKYKWSTKTIAKLFETYRLEKPNIGRPKGFKVKEGTKEKMRRRYESED